MTTLTIRDSMDADVPAIRRIYAHHVLSGLASFEEAAPTDAEMAARRQDVIGRAMPYLAAVLDGAVVGYSYVSPYRSRSAYRHTIENSVYVAHDRLGHGNGSALLEALLARCEAGPWRQVIAVIGDSGNHASIRLHARAGFRMVGTLGAVGFKLGRWVDTVLMQRPLGTAGTAA
jgi:phosphinothricin acetyltransferase